MSQKHDNFDHISPQGVIQMKISEKKTAGYDYEPKTAQDWQDYRAESDRRGHLYELFVEGDNLCGYDVVTLPW